MINCRIKIVRAPISVLAYVLAATTWFALPASGNAAGTSVMSASATISLSVSAENGLQQGEDEASDSGRAMANRSRPQGPVQDFICRIWPPEIRHDCVTRKK